MATLKNAPKSKISTLATPTKGADALNAVNPFMNTFKQGSIAAPQVGINKVLSRIEIAAAFKRLFEPWRYKVYYGGRGGAKSWQIARALLIVALTSKKRILCAREFQTSLEDSVMPLLLDQIRLLGLQAYFRVTKKGISVPSTGSNFRFTGLRINPLEFKGFEGVDILWIEEGQAVSRASLEIVKPTIRKDGSEIWISFNPLNDTDPIYTDFVLNPPSNALVVKVGWQDNPWFPDTLNEERLHMLKTDPDAYSWIWDGYCRKISDAVVFRGKFTVEGFETPSDVKQFYFGADWGFGPDPLTLNRCFIKNKCLYLDYEAHAIGADLNDIASLFDAVPEARRWPIEADNSQPQTIKHVGQFGFNIKGAKKWPGSIEDGIAYLRGFEQIYIHDRCQYTAEEFRLYSYKTDRITGDVLPILIDRYNHHIDGIRYALTPRITRRGGALFTKQQARRLARGY